MVIKSSKATRFAQRHSSLPATPQRSRRIPFAPNESGEKLAGEEIAGMEHGRPHDHAEPGHSRAPCRAPFQMVQYQHLTGNNLEQFTTGAQPFKIMPARPLPVASTSYPEPSALPLAPGGGQQREQPTAFVGQLAGLSSGPGCINRFRRDPSAETPPPRPRRHQNRARQVEIRSREREIRPRRPKNRLTPLIFRRACGAALIA